MLTVAERTLCLLIFRSAPYSTTVPKNPALNQNQNQAGGSVQKEETMGVEENITESGIRPT